MNRSPHSEWLASSLDCLQFTPLLKVLRYFDHIGLSSFDSEGKPERTSYNYQPKTSRFSALPVFDC